jgi:hypothetical protein
MVFLIFCTLFSGCGPSTEELVATAVAQTAAASTNTPIPPSVTTTPSVTKAPTILPSSTPDTNVLFSDDFSEPSSRYDYADDGGEIKQSEGGLSISVTELEWIFFAYIPGYDYENVAIEVDVLSVEGDPEDSYGVVCRSTASSDYTFEISYDGYYAISLWEEDFGYTYLIDWSRSSAINTGLNNENHLTVICNNNQLILKVNGVLLANVTNDKLSSGAVDLFVSNNRFSNVKVIFDNLLFTKPDDMLDSSEPIQSSATSACQSPSSISAEDSGKLIEVCGEITYWGDVPCPNCALGGYSFLKLDRSFTIISYEWVFNDGWIGDCVRVSDTVEMLGNDPVFVYGKGEGYAGSDCTTDDGIMTCSMGDYFGYYSGCK